MESFGGEVGISKPELLALEAIFRHGALAMSEIAKNLGVGMSTATSIAGRLIEKKLAIRERSEGDRRVVRVALTKKGEKINTEGGTGMIFTSFKLHAIFGLLLIVIGFIFEA